MSEIITLVAQDDYAQTRGDLATVVRQVDVGVLADKFRQFMGSLRQVVAGEEGSAGPFVLQEIHFSAEITASGEFRLLGSGVSASVGGAVTFVLARQDRTEAP